MGNMGIYLIQNKTNGKAYIGKSLELQKRLDAHKYLLSVGKELDSIQADYDLGHEFCFEILFDVESSRFDMKNLSVKHQISTIISNLETWYILKFGTCFNGYNVRFGSFNDKDKACKCCICPVIGERLLEKVKQKKFGEKENFFVKMVKQGLAELDVTPEMLYLKLKSGEP